MQSSGDDLIRRLQQRNADRKCATDGGIHARKPFAPLAAKNLQVAERAVGFRFPELVRAIYLKVGNGGFGPQYGIVGTRGGAKLDGCTLESCYRDMLMLQNENAVWRWPTGLLPLANYGCGMWSCVDCEYKRLPMILWDPNNLDSELDAADARLNWGNSFWDQSASLKTWLNRWLSEEEGPEPKWPSATWMKKRLGFTLPQ
jgi:hypothetical protein